jgi:DNA polymerase-3 subunit beta
MRFQIDKKDLTQHIQHLASIIPTKNTSPILANYLLEAISDTNTLRITATDLEITAIAEFNAHVMEDGVTTVNARSFNEIINSMPDALISVFKLDEIIKIQCGKIDFSLLCADHTLFPVIPEKHTHNALLLNAELFQKMVSKTIFAVSTDVNRAVLNGVCWLIKNDSQMMSATDGRKVAEFKLLLPVNTAQPASEDTAAENPDLAIPVASTEESIFDAAVEDKGIEKILPTKTLNFILKIFNADIKELQAVIEPNRVMFVMGEYTVFTHVLDHKYPDYRKAFMFDLPNVLITSRDALRTAIRRVALMAPEDNMRIHFEISADNFEVNTTNRDTGEAKQVMEDYVYTGSNTSISINFKYILSILDSIDSDKVKIYLGAQKEPMMIYNETPQENQEIIFLLMPLRS